MSSSEREELKPCPFCGDVPTTIEADETQGYKWGRVICCIQGPEVRTGYDTSGDAAWHAEAIAAWNCRAQASAEPVAWAAGDWLRAITETELAGIPNTGSSKGRRDRCRSMYRIPLYAAPQQAPLTAEQVREIVKEAGFDRPKALHAQRAAFISGLRHGEVAHGITAAKEST